MRKSRCQRFIMNDVLRYTKDNRNRIRRMVWELRRDGLTYNEIREFCIERNIKNSKGDTPSSSSVRTWYVSAEIMYDEARRLI